MSAAPRTEKAGAGLTLLLGYRHEGVVQRFARLHGVSRERAEALFVEIMIRSSSSAFASAVLDIPVKRSMGPVSPIPLSSVAKPYPPPRGTDRCRVSGSGKLLATAWRL